MKGPDSGPPRDIKSLDATPLKSPVVDIGQDETRQHEEERNGQSSQATAHVGHPELVTDMVHENEQRRDKSQPRERIKLVCLWPHLDRIGTNDEPT